MVALTKDDDPGSLPHPHLGFAVLPEYNGKGYAIQILRYAKEELGVEIAFAFCDAGNKNSGRVSVKAGLEFRGTRGTSAICTRY